MGAGAFFTASQPWGKLVPLPELFLPGGPRSPSPRSCTLEDPWDRGGVLVDQVGLGTSPARHQLPVLPPHRLDVEPVCTHQDLTLLEKREQPGAHSPPRGRGPLWATTAPGLDLP